MGKRAFFFGIYYLPFQEHQFVYLYLLQQLSNSLLSFNPLSYPNDIIQTQPSVTLRNLLAVFSPSFRIHTAMHEGQEGKVDCSLQDG